MRFVQVVLALHIIFMVAWFAGLFYLPRLFVYHAEATDSISIERFKFSQHYLGIGQCPFGRTIIANKIGCTLS